ncbi:hypothetical protein B1748_05535 [Paenibacillus sp. MY03]|jgi:hypothetical protein|uniref:Pvc16 N-terminal domain-containing protein n=1 Tax=Paenibacillus agaridevorans TaxID=171404 RepID=A0A2R5EJM1_9BACL|nr:MULTISPECIES: DUF4255 domain-containing protein [Paenibacillus]OUS78219.1 hypothetical protein B1748_05535 [Paenibacillus sp. MY03]QNK59803.1 DUF4255 domain-containing protein [Paenibacillus sp. PAMC21692]GBG06830.1 hypothetical protein PAT3040_01369 [Paenibacillus agaridevorans]
MGSYTVIADAGASLLKLLREEMTPDPVSRPELIGMASPADKGDLNISVYICAVRENNESRRTEMLIEGDMLRYPPRSIDLECLITAHSSADILTRTLDEHRLLGKVAQILHDNSVLRGPMLEGTLADSDAGLKISPLPYGTEDLTRLWQFGDAPYKLSLAYRIGPVHLDSNRVKPAARVVERRITLREKERG